MEDLVVRRRVSTVKDLFEAAFRLIGPPVKVSLQLL